MMVDTWGLGGGMVCVCEVLGAGRAVIVRLVGQVVLHGALQHGALAPPTGLGSVWRAPYLCLVEAAQCLPRAAHACQCLHARPGGPGHTHPLSLQQHLHWGSARPCRGTPCLGPPAALFHF